MKSFVLAVASSAFLLAAGPAGTQPLEPASARAAAEELAGLLERDFLFPDIGARYAAALRQRAAAGAYDGIADPAALAATWDGELRAIHADAHLRVLAVEPSTDPGGAMQRVLQEAGAPAAGRWLGEGVAYLPIKLLRDDPASVAAMAEFLDSHAGATTLVLDLRACMGGTLPEMDELFARLYAEPARLVRMDMRDRSNADVRRMFDGVPTLRSEPAPAGLLRWDHWAEPRKPAGPWSKARVYVLTDVTASACEHLAYALRLTGRATLVGGTTRGAGHFGGFRRFGGRFEAFVPVGRTYDVASGTGWEGTGIAPDIAVAPAEALAAALADAGLDPAVAATVPVPQPPARVVDAGGTRRRYGLAFAPPRGGETSLPLLAVIPGTAAERAGLKAGDRILKLNGRPVAAIGAAEFPGILGNSPLDLAVERAGAEFTVHMTLDESPRPGD